MKFTSIGSRSGCARPPSRCGRFRCATKLVPIPVSSWYRAGVNLNIKNLDDGVAARLAEQAAAEGMSQQEWLRQILRRTASRFSPAELEAQRSGTEPMSASEFAALQAKVAERRRREVASVGPSRSRR